MSVIYNSTEYMPVVYTHPNSSWSDAYIVGAMGTEGIRINYPTPISGSYQKDTKYKNILVFFDHANNTHYSYYPAKYSGDAVAFYGTGGTQNTGFALHDYESSKYIRAGYTGVVQTLSGTTDADGNSTPYLVGFQLVDFEYSNDKKINIRHYIWVRTKLSPYIIKQGFNIEARTYKSRLTSSDEFWNETVAPNASINYSSNTLVVDSFTKDDYNYYLLECEAWGDTAYSSFYTDGTEKYLYVSGPKFNSGASSTTAFDYDIIRSMVSITMTT